MNLKIGSFIFCGGDDDICFIIFSRLAGNQQFLAKTGVAMSTVGTLVICFLYLLIISVVTLLGFGVGSPGEGNMGSENEGFLI